MLYALLNLLFVKFEALSFFRLFTYITFRAILASITAFILSITLGPPLIRLLKRKKISDIAWDYGLVDIEGKTGTPTMGGLLILGTVGFSSILWCDLTNRFVQILIVALGWFVGMGFLDDYLKMSKKSKTGLKEKYKLLLQGCFGMILGILYLHPLLSPIEKSYATVLQIPFYKNPLVDLGFFYVLFIVFTIIAISNSVNLADGLDGLAVVPSFFTAIVYGIFAYVIGNTVLAQHFLYTYIPGAGEIAIFCASIFGAGLGYLWYNAYPAEIFMGDIGSLGLGGILGTIAILIKQEFLFLIAGGIFVAEAASVFCQKYLYLPIKKKRLFFRAPLHHTFQHRGLAETKVVIRFWIVAAILALISLSALKIR